MWSAFKISIITAHRDALWLSVVIHDQCFFDMKWLQVSRVCSRHPTRRRFPQEMHFNRVVSFVLLQDIFGTLQGMLVLICVVSFVWSSICFPPRCCFQGWVLADFWEMVHLNFHCFNANATMATFAISSAFVPCAKVCQLEERLVRRQEGLWILRAEMMQWGSYPSMMILNKDPTRMGRLVGVIPIRRQHAGQEYTLARREGQQNSTNFLVRKHP